MKILITAVGGDLGQSMIKALRIGEERYQIFGSDIQSGGLGINFVDHFIVVPKASRLRIYLKAINQICLKHRIKCIIPASEIEIQTLGKAYPSGCLPCGTKIVSQSYSWSSIYGDKFSCMKNLKDKIYLPDFCDGSNLSELRKLIRRIGYPVVVKPRISSGSRFIQIAHNQKELTWYLQETEQPIVQEYLDEKIGEYSIGAFVFGKIRKFICFKRTLGSVGCSWYAEISQDKQILKFADELANIIQLEGSANFQVRKTSAGIGLLEINPRFSSLIAARAACKFFDLEWSIQQHLGNKIKAKKIIYPKIRFQRFFHEMIDTGKGFKCLVSFNRRGKMVSL
jgi:carbamoyl-phosphate synthase large subunit